MLGPDTLITNIFGRINFRTKKHSETFPVRTKTNFVYLGERKMCKLVRL